MSYYRTRASRETSHLIQIAVLVCCLTFSAGLNLVLILTHLGAIGWR